MGLNKIFLFVNCLFFFVFNQSNKKSHRDKKKNLIAGSRVKEVIMWFLGIGDPCGGEMSNFELQLHEGHEGCQQGLMSVSRECTDQNVNMSR